MTKEQERARARRRHEEQQKTAKPAVSDSTRDKQVFGVILAVILVLAAVIAVPKFIGSSDTPAAAGATPSAATWTRPGADRSARVSRAASGQGTRRHPLQLGRAPPCS